METPLGNTTTTVYGEFGEIERVVEPSGQSTVYSYDNVGRIERQLDSVSEIVYRYDGNGNPTEIVEGSAVISREYDSMNRVERYEDASGNVVQYSYDLNGNLESLTYPDGKIVSYSYDSQNRLKTVTDWTGRVTTYLWDRGGRMVGMERPNGTRRLNSFTNAQELREILEFGPNDMKLLSYTRFEYDLDSRLQWRYRLPAASEVSEENLPRFTATYDADNRVQTWNSLSVSHDVDGNMVYGPLPTAEGFASYSFDSRNRLSSVDSTLYRYDSENNLTSSYSLAGETSFVWDPHGDALPRVLQRIRPDGKITHYVYGVGLLYEVDENGEASYYHYDQSGSTIALTSDLGVVTDRVEYSPFGTMTLRTGSTETPFLYAGQFGVHTEGNGLLYMRARFYSPELRRFINADPIGFGGGLNWYAYTNNSPLLHVDPNGEALWIAILVGAVIGAGVDVAITASSDYLRTGRVDGGNIWRAVLRGALVGGLSTVAPLAAGATVKGLQWGGRLRIPGGMTGSVATDLGYLYSGVAGGLGQLAWNITDSERSWHDGVALAMFSSMGGTFISNRLFPVHNASSFRQFRGAFPRFRDTGHRYESTYDYIGRLFSQKNSRMLIGNIFTAGAVSGVAATTAESSQGDTLSNELNATMQYDFLNPPTFDQPSHPLDISGEFLRSIGVSFK